MEQISNHRLLNVLEFALCLLDLILAEQISNHRLLNVLEFVVYIEHASSELLWWNLSKSTGNCLVPTLT